MAFQTVFKRYELKYMLTLEQKEKILKAMSPYMELDKYGRTTIRNIYFDTDDYRLIRRSIEKPVYKEKLRIRSYSQAEPQGTVFVELKKKYEKVVYKMYCIIGKSGAGKTTLLSLLRDLQSPRRAISSMTAKALQKLTNINSVQNISERCFKASIL